MIASTKNFFGDISDPLSHQTAGIQGPFTDIEDLNLFMQIESICGAELLKRISEEVAPINDQSDRILSVADSVQAA